MTQNLPFRLTVRWHGVEEYELRCQAEIWPGIPESEMGDAEPPELQHVEVLNVEKYVFRRWGADGPTLYSTDTGPPMWDEVEMRWKQVEREFATAIRDAAESFWIFGESNAPDGPRTVYAAHQQAQDWDEDDWDEDDYDDEWIDHEHDY